MSQPQASSFTEALKVSQCHHSTNMASAIPTTMKAVVVEEVSIGASDDHESRLQLNIGIRIGAQGCNQGPSSSSSGRR